MATTSEVKSGLDVSASIVAEQRDIVDKAQSNADLGTAALAAITTDYADVIATIDAYAGSDVFETLTQAEKAKLQTEFTALKGDADAIVAI